eukprot:g3191.t2
MSTHWDRSRNSRDSLFHQASFENESHHIQFADIETLVKQYGCRLLDISPQNITRLKIATDNGDMEDIAVLLGNEFAHSLTKSMLIARSTTDIALCFESFIEFAINTNKVEWVKYLMIMIAKKSIPFEMGARILNENFSTLWSDCRNLVEEALEMDILGWDICSCYAPIEIFTNDSNRRRTARTGNSIEECIQSIQILGETSSRKVKASVKIYCFENVCKTGRGGILRFLLLHRAPNSIFKTPLIKHIVEFKCEYYQREQRVCRIRPFDLLSSFFLLVLVGAVYFVYAVTSVGASIVVSSMFAILLLIMEILKLRRECCLQRRAYIEDTRDINSSSYSPGIGYYTWSEQNQDNMVYVLLALAWIYIYGILGSLSPIDLHECWAIFTLLALVLSRDVFFHSQWNYRRATMTTMVEIISQRCFYFIHSITRLTLVLGTSLCLVSLNALNLDGDEGDENKLKQSIGTPLKAAMTLFYSTFGLFDPTMFEYGQIQWFMIPILIFYMVLQCIITLDTLVAAIENAFDEFGATKQTSVCKTRAKFVDRYEASLSDYEIKTKQ